MILLTKLLLAHLLGDFIFQPEDWVKEKENKKLRSGKLYLHTLVHALLVLLLVWNIRFWPAVAIIAATHLLIDALKLIFQHEKNRRLWFIVDQALHIIVIVIVWYWWDDYSLRMEQFDTRTILIVTTVIVFLTNPSSVIIKNFIAHWTPDKSKSQFNSLPAAGKIIGILERLFVLSFILTNHWEAVGFLLAAKSVFRFGDLKDSHDLKLTEYVLIGTLLSFGIAIASGVLVSWCLK